MAYRDYIAALVLCVFFSSANAGTIYGDVQYYSGTLSGPVITYSMGGEITQFDNLDNPPPFNLGDSWSMTLQIPANTPDTSGPASGRYKGVTGDLNIGTYMTMTNTDGEGLPHRGNTVSIVNQSDAMAFGLQSLDESMGLRYRAFSQFYDSTNTAFSNTNLISTTLVELGDFDTRRLVLIETPIPAAAWLFGSALALLGWMRRKSI